MLANSSMMARKVTPMLNARTLRLILACLAIQVLGMGLSAQVTSNGINWFQSPVSQRWYGASPTRQSWAAGEALAQTLGGHLATIRSASENAWLASTFSSISPWIGLTDAAVEGVWVWTSGEPVTFTNWAPTAPNGGNLENGCYLIGAGHYHATQWEDWWVVTASEALIEVSAPPPPAIYTTFGTGCSRSQSVPSLDATAGSAPILGTTSTLRLTNLPAGVQVPVFVLGFSDTQNAGPLGAHALPFDLSPLGFPGCWQYVSDDSTQFTLALNGYADWQITLPSNSILAGFRFYVQAAVPDALTGSVSVSNAVGAVIGY